MPIAFPMMQGFVRHVVVAGIGDGAGREAMAGLDGVKLVAAATNWEIAPGAILAFVVGLPGRPARQAARALRDRGLPVVGIAAGMPAGEAWAAADVAEICEAAIGLPDGDAARLIVRCVADPIANPGLINIVAAEVRELFRGMGPATFAAAEAEGPDRVARALDAALSRSWTSRRAWINLEAGPDLPLADVAAAGSRIRQVLAADADAVLACAQKVAMTGRFRVSLIAAAGG